ncbi:MAG: ATP-binding protein [Deltaproteobacteria bacterium]|nr:ATP-binding protein [Deltaproteobacteria bacterium]
MIKAFRQSEASVAADRPSALLAVPVTVLLLGILSLVLLLWTREVSGLRARNFARMDAIMDMQVYAANSHLELEEYIEERTIEYPTRNVEDVRRQIDHALALSRILTGGGATEYGLVVEPLDDPALRARAELLSGILKTLQAITEERISIPWASSTGTPIDERYDAVYEEFTRQAKAFEIVVEETELAKKIHWKRLTAGVFSAWALILGVAVGGLFHRQRQRFRAEWSLRQAREALERANLDLEQRVREQTESLRTTNEALVEKIAQCTQAQDALFRHQEQLRALSSELTLAEERERRRLATELHDRIGTGLAFAKIKLASLLRDGSADGCPPELRDGLGLIDQAIADARTLTFELSSPILYEMGLEAAIDWLAEKTAKDHGLQVVFESCNLPRDVPEDVSVLLFQAVRELLANVVKHARAREVRISCAREEDDVRIVVEDDGAGFATPANGAFRARQGFGLFSIRERLGSLGGLIEIEPAEPGTRVTLVAPLNPTTPEEESLGGDSRAPGG